MYSCENCLHEFSRLDEKGRCPHCHAKAGAECPSCGHKGHAQDFIPATGLCRCPKCGRRISLDDERALRQFVWSLILLVPACGFFMYIGLRTIITGRDAGKGGAIVAVALLLLSVPIRYGWKAWKTMAAYRRRVRESRKTSGESTI